MASDPRLRRPLVTVTALSKTYGRVVALNDVAFSIRRGEILGLIGPNGAGKTTLFECLAAVQPADRGQVALSDADGTPTRLPRWGPRHDTARRADVLFYLPDGIAPWPDQPVEWALQFMLHFLGGRADLYNEILARLGVAPLMHTPIGALSKGQRKRALLAMGLLTPQPVLLIDEPFEGLDLAQSREAAKTLRWATSLGRTLFVSIHQIIDAGRFCDRFVLLSSGRVCAEGTADELTARAAGLRGGAAPADFEEVFLALA